MKLILDVHSKKPYPANALSNFYPHQFYLDGVEISCHPHLHYGGSHADAMKKIAEENGKILTCGGDYHGDVSYRPRCGAYLPETVTDGVSLGKYLAEAKTLTMTVHEPGGEVFSVEYERQGETGKLVLRDVLDKYVPEELMNRPKKGFSIPIDKWLKEPELREWAEALIDRKTLESQGILNADVVWKIWNDFMEKGIWRIQIWFILMFQAWMAERAL